MPTRCKNLHSNVNLPPYTTVSRCLILVSTASSGSCVVSIEGAGASSAQSYLTLDCSNTVPEGVGICLILGTVISPRSLAKLRVLVLVAICQLSDWWQDLSLVFLTSGIRWSISGEICGYKTTSFVMSSNDGVVCLAKSLIANDSQIWLCHKKYTNPADKVRANQVQGLRT